MKKVLVFALCVALLIWSVPVFAVPALQMDIDEGWYNPKAGAPGYNSAYNEETIVSSSKVFTLYALMGVTKDTDLNDNYYISMALYPSASKTTPGPEYGSFVINGETIPVTGNTMAYGTPKYEDGTKSLPSHGVYDTYYALYDFSFLPANKVGVYNTQDEPGGFTNHPYLLTGPYLYYAAFDVDTTKLNDNVSIHFDLFNNRFAPFSHDAGAQSDPPQVPEPATMLLLGLGLVALARVRRKFQK